MGNSLDRVRMRDTKPGESVTVVADVEQDGVKSEESVAVAVAVVSDLEQGSVKPESVTEITEVEQGKEKEEEKEGEGLTLKAKAIANKLRNRLFHWRA